MLRFHMRPPQQCALNSMYASKIQNIVALEPTKRKFALLLDFKERPGTTHASATVCEAERGSSSNAFRDGRACRDTFLIPVGSIIALEFLTESRTQVRHIDTTNERSSYQTNSPFVARSGRMTPKKTKRFSEVTSDVQMRTE